MKIVVQIKHQKRMPDPRQCTRLEKDLQDSP